MSLVLKFKAWLRNWLYADQRPQIAGRPANIKDGAMQIVERTRLGDQNAMALMRQIGINATKHKQPLAIKSYKAMMRYIKANPITQSMSFGEEDESELDSIAHQIQGSLIAGDEDYCDVVCIKVPDLALRNVNKAIVSLANGPSLLPDEGRFNDVRKSLAPEHDKAFMQGYKHGIKELESIPEELVCPFLLGHVVGTARKIQAIRNPEVPLSVLSPRMGAELGE